MSENGNNFCELNLLIFTVRSYFMHLFNEDQYIHSNLLCRLLYYIKDQFYSKRQQPRLQAQIFSYFASSTTLTCDTF